MTDREGSPGLPVARQMRRGLRAVRTEAPDGLLPGVLERVGLTDQYVELRGPIGPIFVAYGARGISSVERAGDPADFEASFRARFGRPVRRAAQAPEKLTRAVRARLGGDRGADIPLDLATLTPFERDVLAKTAEIPHGEVRPYAWVAREIGRPRAVRAVGSALANNPVPFVVPCHRVVRSDGVIGQYGAGGPASKRAVLAAEGLDAGELERLARAGVRYLASNTTGVFCYPTCRHARRITPQHRVPLRSGGDAAVGGFRPCRVCRPAPDLDRVA